MSQRLRCRDVSIRPLGCRNAGHALIGRMLWLGLVIGLANPLLPFASAQVTDRPPDTMEARLRACAACHGEQGQGTDNDYFPRLAGKPAGYLMNQLVAFRDGRRRYPPMNYLLEYLPDSYLQQIADYFSGLRPPPPPPADRRCQSRHPGARTGDCDARRSRARRARLLGVSRPRAHRHGTSHPRPCRAACELHQRATGRIPLRHPHRSRARLHATRRRQPDRERRDRRRRLARVPPRSSRSITGSARFIGDADGLRQRTELRGGERHAQLQRPVGHRPPRRPAA